VNEWGRWLDVRLTRAGNLYSDVNHLTKRLKNYYCRDNLEFVIPACGQPEFGEFGLIYALYWTPAFAGVTKSEIPTPYKHLQIHGCCQVNTIT
jgi:hypothetical protein